MEFLGGEGAAARGSCFDSDNHEGRAVEDGFKWSTDGITTRLSNSFNVIHRSIADDGNGFGIVQRIGDECFEFGEACGIVVPYELVDQDDLIVNRG